MVESIENEAQSSHTCSVAKRSTWSVRCEKQISFTANLVHEKQISFTANLVHSARPITGHVCDGAAKERMLSFPSAAALAPHCRQLAHYEGSEDASLWRAGLAFQSSGLVPSTTQGGLLLLVNMSGDGDPRVQPMELRNLSSSLGFRPHGIHIDNATQRVYAVSHSDLLEEESIAVFDIIDTVPPALTFRYALTSPAFEYYPREQLWFLNDLVTIDGSLELFATQFGPQPTGGSKQTSDKWLLRCTWNEADTRSDGRLPAMCTRVAGPSLGLNGIAIAPSKFGDANGTRTLFVNDLYQSQLWTFERHADGSLVQGANLSLPGIIDNVEYDFASADLTMGMFYASRTGSNAGGLMIARRHPASSTRYRPARVVFEQDTGRQWQVSTSLVYGRHTILGSPWDSGPLVCTDS